MRMRIGNRGFGSERFKVAVQWRREREGASRSGGGEVEARLLYPSMTGIPTYPNHTQQLARGRRRVRHAPCQHELLLHAAVAQATAAIVTCRRGRVFDSHGAARREAKTACWVTAFCARLPGRFDVQSVNYGIGCHKEGGQN